MAADDEFETIASSFSEVERHVGQEMYQAGVAKEFAVATWFVARAETWQIVKSAITFLFFPVFAAMVIAVIWFGMYVFGR